MNKINIKLIIILIFFITPIVSFGQVLKTENFTPFEKHLEIKGLTLVGMFDVEDDFLSKVEKIIESCFISGPHIDKNLQKNLINTFKSENIIQRIGTDMSNYKGGRIDEVNYPGWDNLHDNNRAVDFIWQLPEYEQEAQILEIIEHFLHTTTVLGFFDLFPENMWNYENKNSELNLAMNEAIKNGSYNIESYKEIKKDDPYAYNLIIAQEYAFWVIITAWDYKSIFIPNAKPEWYLNNPKELKQKNPLGYKLYQESVKKVLSKPDLKLIKFLFPNNNNSKNYNFNVNDNNNSENPIDLELKNKINNFIDELNNFKIELNNNQLNEQIDILIGIFNNDYL